MSMEMAVVTFDGAHGAVRELSLDGAADARDVLNWLAEQADEEGRDRWPTEQIAFHGESAASTIEPRRSGAREWARTAAATDDSAVPSGFQRERARR